MITPTNPRQQPRFHAFRFPAFVVQARHVVRRKLMGPFGYHHGVELTGGFDERVVVELDARDGLRVLAPEEFARGMPVGEQARIVDAGALREVLGRSKAVFEAGGWAPYNLSTNNCEHLARFIMHGIRESKQVSGALVGLAGAGLFFALAKLH